MADIPSIDPFTAQYNVIKSTGKSNRMKNKQEAQAVMAAYMQDPTYKAYVESGRIQPIAIHDKANAADTRSAIQGQLAQMQEQDKRIINYYELATGQAPTQEAINKLAKFAADPALLTAAVEKEAATAPAMGKYAESIEAAIQERMGRGATEAEKQYFGKQMERGNLDAYGLGTFLEGTTEYQTKSSDTARGKLATELGGVDQSYLDKVGKQLQAQYSAQGRSGAGAFGSALIGAGKDIATQRTGYLAGLGYQDFQRGQQNLRSDYEAQLARQYSSQQMGSSLGQESRARYYGQQDFNRSQAAQERLARLNQPKTGSFLQNLAPGLINTAAMLGGAALMGPAGAAVGSSSGQGLNSSYYYQQPRSNYVMR